MKMTHKGGTETVIQRRIERTHKDINPHVNEAVVGHYKIEIKTLQTALRTIRAIEILLEKKRRQAHNASCICESEPIYDEIAALDWLLSVTRLQNDEHCIGEIV